MQLDSVKKGQKILLVDDFLATGGKINLNKYLFIIKITFNNS